MPVRLTTPCALDPGELAAWARTRQDHPELDSPYFRPEFVQAVACVRDDVEVAVLRERDEAVGFFPFQRVAPHAAAPVGGRWSDYQA